MDIEGTQSPSQSDDDNLQVEELDDDALTVHHVGLVYGCNNDNVYVPTSAEVYDSIDQDCLFATANNNDNTPSDDTPAFLGMVLTANDDNDDDELAEPEREDMNDEDLQHLPRGFDVNNPTNILATAIHQVALEHTSTEAAAEGWFESVRAKLKSAEFTRLPNIKSYTVCLRWNPVQSNHLWDELSTPASTTTILDQ